MPVDSSLLATQFQFLPDAAMPGCLPQIEIDCDMAIGNELFTFYFPVEVGDFVIQLWSKAPGLDFFLKMFENGQPISVRDRRFHNMKWFSKLSKSWQQQTFNRREVDEMIIDLTKLQAAKA
mmetsp:Transcript_12102/g.16721  ORF Transcript_12102/g.16721 Transcript_12102/m.16721 type:complete len:121 (-) Transcript_12102:246-608(-)|eukprot:CAMPEP_0168555716 /NCGR_PEP_ID=MMETSP0413-20121227/8488_1 /TAXON_ID=136452 /ORGANISM="Filamoeba nolandi, Strain NC-AS-23-1" /LENGTH=120 /DNA_ID=CAMNT_0008586595 /DNA_START=76 /DNA_END=438 /DNA_ORIENTATION=-